MKIEQWAVEKVIPYERNPRINEGAVEATAKSIEAFGFRQPIVVDKDGVIVVGHTRLKAAQSLGLEKVPVHVAELTEAEAMAYRIADNKTGELAEWDYGLLEKELLHLEELGFDLDVTGFGDFDFTGNDESDVDPDEIPNEKTEVKCKLGQVWKLGDHRLMCGDSTSCKDVDVLMGGQLADLWLTDPPYNVDYEGGTGLKIQNDNMPDEKFREFLRDAFGAANSVMRDGAAFYIWHADSEGYNFRGACRDVGLQVRQCIIWNKSSLVLGRQDYQWKHEPCLYGWKGGAGHKWFGGRDKVTVQDFGDSSVQVADDGSVVVSVGEQVFKFVGTASVEVLQSSVIYEEKPAASKLHPTMKPVALYSRQIKYSSKPGWIVLDSFGGSGTTIIACEKLRRRAFVMEYDEKYCDVIIRRWEEYTGKKAELVEG